MFRHGDWRENEWREGGRGERREGGRERGGRETIVPGPFEPNQSVINDLLSAPTARVEGNN